MDLSLFIKRRYELCMHYYTSDKYNIHRRTRLMLLDAVINSAGHVFTEPYTMIHNLEIGVYNHAYDTCKQNGHLPKWDDYRFRAMYSSDGFQVQMFLALRPDIVERLKTGELVASRLLYYPIYELFPEKKKIWERPHIRKQQLVKVKTTSDYPCPECGGRNASQTEVQTRGCDESSTSTFKCFQCGHKWSEDD